MFFDGDSLDREAVRDIILEARGAKGKTLNICGCYCEDDETCEVCCPEVTEKPIGAMLADAGVAVPLTEATEVEINNNDTVITSIGENGHYVQLINGSYRYRILVKTNYYYFDTINELLAFEQGIKAITG